MIQLGWLYEARHCVNAVVYMIKKMIRKEVYSQLKRVKRKTESVIGIYVIALSDYSFSCANIVYCFSGAQLLSTFGVKFLGFRYLVELESRKCGVVR